MTLSERQLTEYANQIAWRIPFNTTPRHLAGPGDARYVTHGLAAAGWNRTSDPLSPDIVLTSPGLRYSLQFDPQSTTSAWWRLRAKATATEPGWYAEFGELLPAEILAGLTDALVAPPRKPQADPWQTLSHAGWPVDDEGRAHSPDGMIAVETRASASSNTARSWHIDASKTEGGPRLWHASFTSDTPTHLIGGFIAALTSPEPLQRGMFDRVAHYSAVQKSSPLTPEQVIDVYRRRIDSLRRRSRAHRRRQQALTTTPAPATPPRTTPTAHSR